MDCTVKEQLLAVSITGLAKNYNRQKVFSNVSWQPAAGKLNLITGPNGSGKSTLMRLISGLEKPTQGLVTITLGNSVQPPVRVRKFTGLLSPDLSYYKHLTALENLQFMAKISGLSLSRVELKKILAQVGLVNKKDIPLAAFSTGMKQRLKLACAIFKKPALLLLDEPGANLDNEGKKIVTTIINEFKTKSMVIMATNDREEVRMFGENILFLGHDYNSYCC